MANAGVRANARADAVGSGAGSGSSGDDSVLVRYEMNITEVTERDFRRPEFRNADPKDYEFRGDGKIARKDRWETGIHRIVNALGMSVREFEIDDVVYAIETIIGRMPANPCTCGCCKIGQSHDRDCSVHNSDTSTDSDCDCTLSCSG